jgi:hypothetical protein
MLNSKLKSSCKELHVLDEGLTVELKKRSHELGTCLFGSIAEVIHLNLNKVLIVTDELRGVIVVGLGLGLCGSEVVIEHLI